MKIWKERKAVEQSELAKFAEHDPAVARLLLGRGITNSEEAEQFLKPQYKNAHNPFLLKGIKESVSRIEKAIENKEQVTVYADYDADAVTAAAVLILFFKEVGHKKIDYYIPDRFSEGYGVNQDAISKLAEQGTSLIITVDTGTNALDAVEKANSLGVDVIVTDHHQVNAGLPKACAVVNPHQEGDEYPFKELTGVGVAFKLIQALISVILEGASATDRISLDKDSIASLQNDRIKPGWEKWLLDLVAIGTIADCQSLLGENRILAKWGLLVLEKTRWLGLRRLIEVAEIDSDRMNSYTVGFQIAPRINAAGRIDHAAKALELLITDDGDKATELAYELNELNAKRQNLTDQILSEAREQVVAQHGAKIRFAYDQGWPLGILGLVAGRLAQEFNRPVLVMSLDDGVATGSARSIEGFSVIKALRSAGDLFEKYGGHEQAAGFNLKENQIGDLKKTLLEYAEEHLGEELLKPVEYYDAQIDLSQIDDKFVETLEEFEPVGVKNPKPLFLAKNLEPRYPSQIGAEGKHLRVYVGEGSHSFSCIGFGLGYWAQKIESSAKAVDLICEPQYNEWNGERKIQLKIKDIRFSEARSTKSEIRNNTE